LAFFQVLSVFSLSTRLVQKSPVRSPGKEPFGKDAFAASSRNRKNAQIDGTAEIRELQISGDVAWMRNYLQVRITPPGGQSVLRSGYTLTILRKQPDGSWVIARDANLLT